MRIIRGPVPRPCRYCGSPSRAVALPPVGRPREYEVWRVCSACEAKSIPVTTIRPALSQRLAIRAWNIQHYRYGR